MARGDQMEEMIPRIRTEKPKDHMIAAPVDLETKNKIIAIANESFAGIEARVVRCAIMEYISARELLKGFKGADFPKLNTESN